MSTQSPVVDATITATIKALAAGRGTSVDTIASVIGVSKRTLFRYFDTGGWSAIHVKRIADYFDATVGEIYDGRIEHVLPESDGTASIGPSARSSTDRASDYGSAVGVLHPPPFLGKVA